jgi:serine/threonine protein kinase
MAFFMIVMELLHGDLHKLLHKSSTELSFFSRVKMCKDIALGMNWLHKIEPAVVHRDLKTSNLLVEKLGTQQYKVKVADFGISMVQSEVRTAVESGQGSPILGTVLTTAPEIMDGTGTYNEKTDVYSFGLVMWELATRQRLFESYLERGSVGHFVDAICKKHKRPRIPEDLLPDLRVLIEKCWHSNPNVRPSFDEINEQLDQIIVKSAIRDPHGRSFWIKHFLKQDSVPWPQFAAAFYNFLRLPLIEDPNPTFDSDIIKYLYLDADLDGGVEDFEEGSKLQSDPKKKEQQKQANPVSEDVLKLRCLRYLLVQTGAEDYNKGIVQVARFGEILDWFGPILYRRKGSPSCFILDQMKSLLEKPWFFGDVTSQEAQTLIGKEPGCFLVRFTSNPKFPGCFAITRVSASGQPSHIRILRKDNRLFISDDKSFESLIQLIEEVGPALHLLKPCPKASKYWLIFHNPIEEER